MGRLNSLQLGKVYYLTTELMFPRDRDHWVKQEPIAGSSTQAVYFFINQLGIPTENKTQLFRTLETSWKDPGGVWVKLTIEPTKREKKWGINKKQLILS